MNADIDKRLANLNRCLQETECSIETLKSTVFSQNQSIIYTLREVAFETRLAIGFTRTGDEDSYTESMIRRDYLEAEARDHIRAG